MSSFGKISQFHPKKILVAGDLMLDTYTIGSAKRISPEAPVAVIHVQSTDEKPGGAGNAILNLISLGAKVKALGRVGDDEAGKTLLAKLLSEEVDIQGVLIDRTFTTPIKNRVIAENQQVVRVDHEVISTMSDENCNRIIKTLPKLLDGVDLIAISDYGKGFLHPHLLKELIAEAKKRKIFILADPKGSDFTKYRGVNLIKPNLKEAYAAAGFALETPLDEIAYPLLKQAEADFLMVTRSENGITLFSKSGKREDFAVIAKKVKDVTGAGDTVLAVLSMALANNLPIEDAITLSNHAASIAIETLGCARVTLPELAKRAFEQGAPAKIFDEEHIEALKIALKDKPTRLFTVDSEEEITLSLLQIICQTEEGTEVLLHFTNDELDPKTLDLLSSIKRIDYVLVGGSINCKTLV